MSSSHSFNDFAARLREWMKRVGSATGSVEESNSGPHHAQAQSQREDKARCNQFARELFALQFEAVHPYRKLCLARRISPESVDHWSRIPAVPAAAFKEFDLTSIPPAERTRTFHSSGTTGQQPSRHIHSARSIALYEESLLPWFRAHLLAAVGREISSPELLILTPSPQAAPHSSLIHMFETAREFCGAAESAYVGRVESDGGWSIDTTQALNKLRETVERRTSVALLGTAFSFVHLLDAMQVKGVGIHLPPGSRVLETGGYKGRSRALPKTELHDWISRSLGIAPEYIVTEYGMSELSSQAYDRVAGRVELGRCFHFPPWARARVISPETGREVEEGGRGLLRVFDLANVFSVLAIQTEDLAIRRGAGFELLGRAESAEARGCSLMPV
jgi:hypothetical protein